MCPGTGSCRSPPSWTVLRWGRCGWRWWGWAPGTPGTRWTPGTPSQTPELRLNQIPLNSVLFPLSTYVLATLKRIRLNLSEVGSWWFSLEMRQLRLRRRVKAVYLYDLETSEAMVLYRRGRVTITDEYSLNTTLNNRSQHNMAAFYVVQLYIVNISGFKSGFCDH